MWYNGFPTGWQLKDCGIPFLKSSAARQPNTERQVCTLLGSPIPAGYIKYSPKWCDCWGCWAAWAGKGHKSNQPVHQAQGTPNKLLHLFPTLMEKSHFPSLRTFCPCWKLLHARCSIAGGYSCSKTKTCTYCSEFFTIFPKGGSVRLKPAKFTLWRIVAPAAPVPACEPWKKPSWGCTKQLGLSECWPWAGSLHSRGNICTGTSLSGAGQCCLEFGWFLGSIWPAWKSKLLHHGDNESVKGKFRYLMLYFSYWKNYYSRAT